MDSHGKAGGKKANRHQKLRVSIQFVAVPDADERLTRATGILLQVAARAASQAEDSPDADKEKPSAGGTHEATEEGR